MTDVLTPDVLTTDVPAASSIPAVIMDFADFVHIADSDDSVDIEESASPFVRPTAEPWLARGFLAAGHVTVLTGDAYVHGSPLALAWAASLASFRPHGAFVPFVPFSSVVDDRTSYESEQRRRLMDFAGTVSAPVFSIETSVCLAPHGDSRVLFRVEPRRAGFRFYPALAMDALVGRAKRLNAGILAMSMLDTVTPGTSMSADLTRDVLRVLAAVAAERRIAALVVHDSPRSGMAIETLP